MTTSSSTHTPAPAGLALASQALGGLAALFSMADPVAWNSLGRPEARDLASLTWTIRSRLDEGIADAGFTLPD